MFEVHSTLLFSSMIDRLFQSISRDLNLAAALGAPADFSFLLKVNQSTYALRNGKFSKQKT